MDAVAEGREHRRGAELNGALAAADCVGSRKSGGRELQGHRGAVDGELELADHEAAIVLLLAARQQSVAIRIDIGEQCRGERQARREIELQLHALRVDREPRRLQVLIEPMC